jgi:hypothetical protein
MMKEKVTSGQICLDDEYGFTYCISEIEYCERDDESYFYTFIPNYSVIELLASDIFQGIPGLDMDQKKDKYIRENITPVFISERTPVKNHENLWELLEASNMEYLNRLEWLIRSNTRYSGDSLYVKRLEQIPFIEVENITALGNRSSAIMRKLLEVICKGVIIKTNSYIINDANRKECHSLLLSIYTQEKMYIANQKTKGIKESAKQGKYKGRGKIKIDDTKLLEVISEYEDHKITGEQAAEKLNISRATFNRRYRIMK